MSYKACSGCGKMFDDLGRFSKCRDCNSNKPVTSHVNNFDFGDFLKDGTFFENGAIKDKYLRGFPVVFEKSIRNRCGGQLRKIYNNLLSVCKLTDDFALCRNEIDKLYNNILYAKSKKDRKIPEEIEKLFKISLPVMKNNKEELYAFKDILASILAYYSYNSPEKK
jgi:CRISPR type III-A-associated protein Csm2